MKGKFYIFITIVIVLLIGCLFKTIVDNKNLNRDLSISRANEKALMSTTSVLQNKNRGLQLTIDQLEYFNDSLIIKINEFRKELKIKDRDLKQMQYLLSEAQKKDTIVFRDTLFRDPEMKIDTLLGDRWYQLNLSLQYPSTVVTEPKFISEKYIIVSLKKETVKSSKKCLIGRWFQKKHKIVEVEVVEKNPYIENKQQRFIEIIK